MYFSVPTYSQTISSCKVLSGSTHLFLTTKLSHLSLTTTAPNLSLKTTTIRMGGGPRTYPGGVSKWQWKRMQANKAKQLLKARMARERQIYEMRKRAELKAAVSELERPWEVIEKAPTLFSARADEQLKVLADRFQRPGGFDMWSEKDGPQLFETVDGVPSSRFFPKGVVHSVKPYGKIDVNELGNSGPERENEGKTGVRRNGYDKNSRKLKNGLCNEGNVNDLNVENSKKLFSKGQSGKSLKAKSTKNGNRRRNSSVSDGLDSGNVSFSQGKDGRIRKQRASDGLFSRGGSGLGKFKDSNLELYDMSLQHDGSYGIKERT